MDYAVVHSGRRTIAIQIQRDGRVVVRAPYAATAEDIRRVVDSHRDWVEKTVRRQQEQLRRHGDLPPVEGLGPPEPSADQLCRQYPRGKGQNGYQIVACAAPVPLHQPYPQQHDISGLGVGEHSPPDKVGIRIQKASGQGQHRPQPKALRHLSVCRLFHALSPSQDQRSAASLSKRCFDKLAGFLKLT